MSTTIEQAQTSGFCYGVKRAIEILENIARERGPVEALGAIVHNQQVVQRMAGLGVTVAESLDDVKGDTVAIGAHGVGPLVEAEIRARFEDVINTTCPFVQRAQKAAARLARDGFFVIVYGDGNHPEVKGILGWANDNGIATMDAGVIASMHPLPRRIGILSQTTQIPARFTEFVKQIIDLALVKDSELRISDTICHDIRGRQQDAQDLADRSDVMLVIGSQTSANTRHLTELCSMITETHLVTKPEDIDGLDLKGRKIGVIGGASTAEETIDEVMERLKSRTT